MQNLIDKYGIQPRKSLGQHFLTDEGAIKKELEAARIKKGETILEIGPGPGALTKELQKQAKKVIAIELDRALAGILKKELPSVEVINADALEIEYPPFDRCVSNIPYSISGKLTVRLGELGKPAVLMYQKEFADRLLASPGKKAYSRISVMAQYYFSPEFITKISRNSFYPPPKVDSAIIRLTPKKRDPEIKDGEMFKKTVSALFIHRNQKAKKALLHSRHLFGIDKVSAKSIAEKMPSAEAKVITLTQKDLREISNYLSEKTHDYYPSKRQGSVKRKMER